MAGEKGQRSCIACGRRADKAALLRIVRAPDGTVSFDPSGRAPGRGAYLCSAECFAAAGRKKKLDRALKTTVGPEDLERLAVELRAAEGEAEVKA